MSPGKTNQAASPHFPTGSRSVHFKDLEEDSWWALLHALEVRIRYFQERLDSTRRLSDPGLERQIEHYQDTIDRLQELSQTAHQQIAPGYWPASPAVSR